MNTFKFTPEKNNSIILGGINSGKEFIAHKIAEHYGLKKEDVIHGDKLRIALFNSLSDSDQKKFFPKMYKLFKGGEKGIDVINDIGIEKYLEKEFEESKFLYEERLHPIIEKLGDSDKKIIVGVQILPELLHKDIIGKENNTGVIGALRTKIIELKNREFEYTKINENHAGYVKTYLEKPINLSKLPEEDQKKLKFLSELLNLPISAYLLHLLAKIEYNRAIEQQLKESGLSDSTTILDTSTNFEEKIAKLLDTKK